MTGGVAPNGKPIWSLDQSIANLLRWQQAWPRETPISFSFLDGLPPGTSATYAFTPFSETERAFARAAFDLISDIVPLTFVEEPWDGVSFARSDRIVLGGNANAASYEWGHARNGTITRAGVDEIDSSEIWISPSAVAVRQWIFGGYNFKALTHEILHALGMPHPGNYNASGQSITYAQNAVYFQDSAQFTILSYFDASNTGANYEWTPAEVQTGLIGHWHATAALYESGRETAIFSPATPMLHDVAALQALYGANRTARSGDTTYGYNSTAGRPAYDFTIANAPIFTIWDGGGIDTLDISLTGAPVRIDLAEGAYSDAFFMTGNIAIAYGAQIENAKGGSGPDSLTGNGLNNRLEGGAGDDRLAGLGGDDTLVGGDGLDVAVYGLRSGFFRWFSNPDGSWSIKDTRAGRPEGSDTLIGIEMLSFSDQQVSLASLPPQDALGAAFKSVLRVQNLNSADAAFVSGLTSQVVSGGASLKGAFGQIVDRADSTTSVATLSYQFFTGATPSQIGLDFLVSSSGGNANSLSSPYYQAFGIDNRYINFAVNLGVAGEGRAMFEAEYGSRSLFEATRIAYAEIFGSTPTDLMVNTLLLTPIYSGGQSMSRAEYLAIYGGDGVDGLGTKAAMVGFLLAVAAIEGVGVYSKSNDAYLTDLADGAGYEVDIVGVYGQSDFVHALG